METLTTEFLALEKCGVRLKEFSALSEEAKQGMPRNLECIIDKAESSFGCETSIEENLENVKFIYFGFYIPEKGKSRIRIGYAHLFINHTTRMIKWQKYYPLQYVQKAEKKGIGIMAHLLVLSKLSELYGSRINSYSVNEGDFVSRKRRNHLTRIGINSFRFIARLQRRRFGVECFETFESYYCKSLAYFERKSGEEFNHQLKNTPAKITF